MSCPSIGNWAPGFTVAPATGLESKAFSLNWSMLGKGPCDSASGTDTHWSGTHHLEIRRAKGTATPPATPSSGDHAATLVGLLTFTDYVQRSNVEYAYSIFACEDQWCTSWWGDGSGSQEGITGNTSGSETTESEVFVLSNIADATDVGNVVVDKFQSQAPTPFFYPSSWDYHPDGLGLYYSVAPPSGDHFVYYIEYTGGTTDSWPDDEVNDSGNWTSPVIVAAGFDNHSDAVDYKADHPWVMFTDDGVDQHVELFVQSQHGIGNNEQISEISSVDADGSTVDAFNGDCDASDCDNRIVAYGGDTDGGGYLAIDAEGMGGTAFVERAQHGRIAWNYIDDGPILPGTDEPWMFFQLDRPDAGDCSDAGFDDIGKAIGSWSSTQWVWTVATDHSSPDCPVPTVDDAHDNSLVALPGGQYKMYYKTSVATETDAVWMVVYWNGLVWEDATQVYVTYSDGSTDVGQSCVENFAVVNHAVPGGGKEGAFMQLLDGENGDLCDGSGLGLNNGGGDDDGAIAWAYLANG